MNLAGNNRDSAWQHVKNTANVELDRGRNSTPQRSGPFVFDTWKTAGPNSIRAFLGTTKEPRKRGGRGEGGTVLRGRERNLLVITRKGGLGGGTYIRD